VAAADLDNDGDLDFVVGNWGINSKFQTSTALPLTMQVGDFDSNGKSEFIINWKAPLDNQTFPFATKIELTAQVPAIKKRGLKYADFAKMQYKDIFPGFNEASLIQYDTKELRSGIYWNEGPTFRFAPLPIEAQFSPVFGINIFDYNKDGTKDIILGGNIYALKPQMGRHNASKGLFLANKGKQTFHAEHNTGLLLDGEVRDMITVGNKVIIARNNRSCAVFRFQ
jgi:enediyne biosynthesis protein E4